MRKSKKLFTYLLFTVLLTAPMTVFAAIPGVTANPTTTSAEEPRVGVAIGTGKIRIDEQLKQGSIYTLPAVTVLNNGNVKTTYSLGIAYHEGQPELKPNKEWFTFEPASFDLDPAGAQEVKVSLTLPLEMQPGDYFAYIEAFPVTAAGGAVTKVNIAAGTKLNFTTAPSSILQALYYRFIALWNLYNPWSTILAVVVISGLVILTAQRYLKIHVAIETKRTENKGPAPTPAPVSSEGGK